MTNLTPQELEHLETLCNVHIDDSQKGPFLEKLDSIVDKLNELNSINTENVDIQSNSQNSLRVLGGISDFPNKKEILDNVKHEVVNNSIVIKSALSNN